MPPFFAQPDQTTSSTAFSSGGAKGLSALIAAATFRLRISSGPNSLKTLILKIAHWQPEAQASASLAYRLDRAGH